MPNVTRRALCSWGLGLGLAAAGGFPARAAGKQIRIGTIAVVNSSWHKAMIRFKEVLEARTQGALAVSIYTDGQLGDIGAMMSGMQLGTIEMCYVGLSSISALRGAEVMNVLYTPYLFPDGATSERVCNGDEFKAIYDRIAASTGIRVVGAWGQRSPRALQTISGPVNAPAQLKGMRLRVPSIEVLKATFETLGAQVVPLGMMEIYTALSRHTIDGQDNGFDLSMPARYYEVAKFWSATNHVYETVGWYMSERVWQSLSPAQRDAVHEAIQAGGAVTSDLTVKLDADSVGVLKVNGCEYTAPDLHPWQSALAGIKDRFEGKLWPQGLVDRLRKA